MFEKVFSSLLNSILAEFIEPGNLSQENLQIGVWNGFVVLEQLVLKKNLFDRLKIPLSLNFGAIGRLEVHIPWNNLGNEPVVIIIDQIFMLMEPKYEWDDVKSRHSREQAAKQAKLAATALFSSRKAPGESTYAGYGDYVRNFFMDTILRKLVDNFEVHITGIHARYEDYISCPTDFCFGITIDAIHVTTRPSDDEEQASKMETQSLVAPKIKSEIFRKLIRIEHFAVYWNPIVADSMDPCTSMLLNRPDADIQKLMLRTLVHRAQDYADRPRHHFIFEPHDIVVESDVTFYKATMTTEVLDNCLLSI